MTMHAAAQAEGMNQGVADVPQAVAEIIEMVQRVEGRYRVAMGDASSVLPWCQVVPVLRDAEKHRVNVQVKNDVLDHGWYIELNDGNARVFGQYRFLGY